MEVSATADRQLAGADVDASQLWPCMHVWSFLVGVGLPACLPVSVCLLSSLCLNSLNCWVVEVSVWQLCGDHAGALTACIIDMCVWQQLYKLPVGLCFVWVPGGDCRWFTSLQVCGTPLAGAI